MDVLRTPEATLRKLDLSASATEVTKGRLDRFPPLIVDYALSEATGDLARQTEAMFSRGWTIASEVLTMPRKSFGSRPAVLTVPAARVLYRALVTSIDPYLPSPTRTADNWQAYEDFGCDASVEYVAQVDMASCYEYIEHGPLEKELIVRSSDTSTSQAILDLLSCMMGRDRGVPQMHWASDRLADAYLDILVRRLTRDGFAVSRYVDDVRIHGGTWNQANDAIERAGEYARDLGLTLTSEKTRVFRTERLRALRDEKAAILRRYFDDAKQNTFRLIIQTLRGPYGELEEFEQVVEDIRDTAQAALWKMLNDWHESYASQGPESSETSELEQAVSLGVTGLSTYADRLPDQLLLDLVFAHPVQLEQVCRYVVDRAERDSDELTFQTVSGMISNIRRGAWATLWILHALGQLPGPPESEAGRLVRSWVDAQRNDRHETVRAQACWVSSQYGQLDTQSASAVYRDASPLTQPALAAAIARQGNISDSVVKAVRNDGALNKKAYEWGLNQIQVS